jgi:hypothetical protein
MVMLLDVRLLALLRYLRPRWVDIGFDSGDRILKLLALIGIFFLFVSAQEAPALFDPDDTITWQSLSVMADGINRECKSLISNQRFEALRSKWLDRMRDKYPCCEVDMMKGTLVPKKKENGK